MWVSLPATHFLTYLLSIQKKGGKLISKKKREKCRSFILAEQLNEAKCDVRESLPVVSVGCGQASTTLDNLT